MSEWAKRPKPPAPKQGTSEPDEHYKARLATWTSLTKIHRKTAPHPLEKLSQNAGNHPDSK